jgi:hypothetical protein
MGAATFKTVREFDCWRVKIAWPRTSPRYFGHFKSEQEAEKWIAEHHWMTDQAQELLANQAAQDISSTEHSD